MNDHRDTQGMSSTCPFCAGVVERHLDLVVDSQSGDDFAIDRCQVCGLGITDPAPEQLDRYYGPEYVGERHGFTARICDRRRVGIVHKQMADSQDRRILDVGCGDGTFMLAAARSGYDVSGVEKYSDIGRGGSLKIYDSLDSACTAGPYDCVTMWHVLEHMRDPETTVRQIKNLLAPGGVWIIAVPDFASVQARWFGAAWWHLDVPRHLYHFTTPALCRLLEGIGGDVRRLRRSEWEYDVMGWATSAVNGVDPESALLFKLMTRRRTDASFARRVAALGMGAVVAMAVAIPVGIAGRLGRGGTIVASVRFP